MRKTKERVNQQISGREPLVISNTILIQNRDKNNKLKPKAI